jgi:hypothetical protein
MCRLLLERVQVAHDWTYPHYSTVKCSTAVQGLIFTVQQTLCMRQHSTAQHSTAQRLQTSAAQRSAAQHSTAHHKVVDKAHLEFRQNDSVEGKGNGPYGSHSIKGPCGSSVVDAKVSSRCGSACTYEALSAVIIVTFTLFSDHDGSLVRRRPWDCQLSMRCCTGWREVDHTLGRLNAESSQLLCEQASCSFRGARHALCAQGHLLCTCKACICRQGCVSGPDVSYSTGPAACGQLSKSRQHAYIQASNTNMKSVIALPFQHADITLVTTRPELHL